MPDQPITLRGVSFTYPSAQAPTIKGIDLQIRAGEFVGIVGPTGSGKTTLLQVLTGVIPHYTQGHLEGEVRFYGQPTQELNLARITKDIGLVMQDPDAQLFNLLVRDELVWGLENRGMPREQQAQRLDETLDFFGIRKLRDRIAYDLSGGEKQRVAMAAVCAIRPRVIVLDNPTSQLDPLGAQIVIEAIRSLARTGDHTIIMVEDKVDELVEFADRIVLIHQGELIAEGTPRAFCSNQEALSRAGIKPPQVAELGHLLTQAGVSLDGIPITLDEAIPAYSRALEQRKGKKYAWGSARVADSDR